MNKFKDRLKIAIKNESIRAFANRAGLTEGMIRKYLRGPALPGLENLIAIAKAAEVNIKWLATSEGPISGWDPLDVNLLAFLLGLYEKYEKDLCTPISPTEKASFINMFFRWYWTVHLDYKGSEERTLEDMRFLHEMTEAHVRLKNSGIDEEQIAEMTQRLSDQLRMKPT
jgi:transcriptional regulator with XRE-family HTH domain